MTADYEAQRAFHMAGLAGPIEAEFYPHPGTEYLGGGGKFIKALSCKSDPFSLCWRPSFILHQPTLEGILRNGLNRFKNVHVFLGESVKRFAQDGDEVVVTTQHPNHGQRLFRGQYLLGCDGASSAVRRGMKSSLDDLGLDEWWVAVDAYVRTDARLPERCVRYCYPGRPGAYIVGPGHIRRWEMKIMPYEDPDQFNDSKYTRRILTNFVDTNLIDVLQTKAHRIRGLVAKRWRSGRVFLLGGAACQMPPFLGEESCSGFQDAFNFAWKLNSVILGGADSSVLDTYAKERRPQACAAVESAKCLSLVVGELDGNIALQRDELLVAGVKAVAQPLVLQPMGSRLRAGLIARGVGDYKRAAGALFPQPWVETSGGKKRLDDVVRWGFYVVSLDEELAQIAACEFAGVPVLADSKVVLVGASVAVREQILCVSGRNLDLKSWFDAFGVRIAIVRPDGFAYGAANTSRQLRALIKSLLLALSRTNGTAIHPL